MVTYYLLFNLFPIFTPLSHVPKHTRLNKIYISTSKYSLSEVNFSPSWSNTLVNIPLDAMADFSVLFTMLTDNIPFNPGRHMVVPFILVPINLQAQYQVRYSKRVHTATNTFQAQRKSHNCMLPQVSSDIH